MSAPGESKIVLYDTSIVIEKVKKREEIHGIISAVTIVEFPAILRYILPFSMQVAGRTYETGKTKELADLLVAAICINRREKLITKDKDSWI